MRKRWQNIDLTKQETFQNVQMLADLMALGRKELFKTLLSYGIDLSKRTVRGKEKGIFENTLWSSRGGWNLETEFPFNAGTFARSFELLNGMCYSGMENDISNSGNFVGSRPQIQWDERELSLESGIIYAVQMPEKRIK